MTHELLHLLAAGSAGALAAGYALFLTLFIAPRVRPVIPRPNVWVAVFGSAVVGGGLGYLVNSPTMAVLAAPLAALLVVPSLVDLACRRIPNAMVIHGYVMSALAAVVGLFVPGATPAGWGPIAGFSALIAVGMFLLLAVLSLTSRGLLGFGDVKYAPILVFFLLALTTSGWDSSQLSSAVLPQLLLAMLAVSWIGVSFLTAGVYVIIRHLMKRRTPFAFGPWMAGGFVIVFVGAHLAGIASIIPA